MVQRAPTKPPRRPGLPAIRLGPSLPLLAAAVGIRLACLPLATVPDATTRAAQAIATNLSTGHGFSRPGGAAATATPTAAMAPLGPVLLSMGIRLTRQPDVTTTALICLLSALAPLLVLRLGAALFGGRSAWFAAWACALDPLLLLCGPGQLQATLFGAALLAGLALTAAWLKRPLRGRALGVGLSWGVCLLATAAAFPLVAMALAWVWSPLGLTIGDAERRQQFGFLLLGIALALTPWTLRNAIVMRAFAPLSTSTGIALLAGNHAAAWSDPRWDGRAVDVLSMEPQASRLRGLGEGARDAAAAGEATRFVVGHAGGWPRAALRKLRAAWDPRGGMAPPGADRGLRGLLIAAWSWIVYAFGIGGLVRTATGPRRWFQALPLLAVASALAITVVFHGSAVGRVPVEPVLVLLATLGFADVRRRLRFRRRGLRVIAGRAA